MALALLPTRLFAQENPPPAPLGELRLHLLLPHASPHRAVPAVAWLDPLSKNPSITSPPANHATLIQKNRMFVPHLQVIPVGTVVSFPNEDPFFHNLFSLFNGKRFAPASPSPSPAKASRTSSAISIPR